MPDRRFEVEVRCPVGPRKLFTKLKLGEEFASSIEQSNLIEFTCGDCSRRLSRERDRPTRIFHQFNFIGELVRTYAHDVIPELRCIEAPTD